LKVPTNSEQYFFILFNFDFKLILIFRNRMFLFPAIRVTVFRLCHWRYIKGRAIVQVIICWLPTAVARVRARVWEVGFVVDKVALGQVFSAYFGFLSQSSFHQILHHHNHPGLVQ
jgi:hypothetical protein